MKRPTQATVARHAGVSAATVSYVLNGTDNGRVQISEETRQRVFAAVEELGYVPDARARALASGSTNTIAVLIPDLRNPHFGEYATGIEQAAREAGYHILLSSSALNDEYALDILKVLARRQVDGLIVSSSFILESEDAHAILADILNQGLPIVGLSDNYGLDTVSADYRNATREAIAYLLSLGHRRIGMVNGTGGQELGLDRLQPFRDSLQAAGIPPEPELIVECGPTIKDGYQAATHLLELASRPTAIIALNDLLAIGTIRAAADLGLHVPNDLSVIGYDNIPMADYLVPRLTTVTKDALNLGRKAFEVLLARLQNPDLPQQHVHCPVRLIIRESTGPAPI
jgi:LacI family transcriptional regulator